MAYTAPTSMTPGQVFTASRWNTMVKDNFDMLASLANDGTLAWDNTNKRLGIGTASPSYKFHLTTTGNNYLLSESISGFMAFAIKGTTEADLVLHASSATSNQQAWNLVSGSGSLKIRLFNDTTGSYGVVRDNVMVFQPGGAVLVGKASGLTGAGDLDINGNCKATTFQTAAGNTWTLGTFSFGTFAQTGYVTVVINGGTYRLMAG